MNKTTTASEARNTIHAFVIMKDGSRVERIIGFNPKSWSGWRDAMRQVGAGLVPTYSESDIGDLATITTTEHGVDVSNYTGPTEAAEILGFLD